MLFSVPLLANQLTGCVCVRVSLRGLDTTSCVASNHNFLPLTVLLICGRVKDFSVEQAKRKNGKKCDGKPQVYICQAELEIKPMIAGSWPVLLFFWGSTLVVQ